MREQEIEHRQTARDREAAGFPIGLFPDAGYDEFRVTLTPGDRIYFYSDGVTDAMDDAESDFGSERLMTLVAGHREEALEVAVMAIRSSVMDWAAANSLQHDLSVVGLELTG